MDEERNYWQRTVGRPLSRRAALRGAGLGVAGLAGAALIGCGDDDDDAPAAAAGAIKRGGIFKTVSASDPPTIDPYGNLSFRTMDFAAHAYSRLYSLGVPGGFPPSVAAANAQPQGDLAESAETADGLTWTVTLKPGIKFHNVIPVNGRELTSDDVVFSFNRLQAPESPNSAAVAGRIGSLQATDERTLVFTLDKPVATFLESLADSQFFWVMPAESDGGFDPATTMIGSGPWIFKDYQPSVSDEWDRNPNWFFQGVDGKSLPYMDGEIEAIVPEYSNRLAQLRAGNLDVSDIQAADLLEVQAGNPEWHFIPEARRLQSFLYFDHTQTTDKPWGDERVRQAISMALDRDALTDLAYEVRALEAAGLPVSTAWNNIVPAGIQRFWLDPQSAAHGDSGKFFNYDPAEAKKLLEAAGFASGFKAPYLRIAQTYGPDFDVIADANISFLEAIGIEVDHKVQDYSAEYITQTFVGDFEGIAYGYETPFAEVGSYFPRQFGDDPANHGKISDAEITALNEKQAVELDFEQRREFIYEIQRINASHMYYVPNQSGANQQWEGYQSWMQDLRQTRGNGYGDPTESVVYWWKNV